MGTNMRQKGDRSEKLAEVYTLWRWEEEQQISDVYISRTRLKIAPVHFEFISDLTPVETFQSLELSHGIRVLLHDRFMHFGVVLIGHVFRFFNGIEHVS